MQSVILRVAERVRELQAVAAGYVSRRRSRRPLPRSQGGIGFAAGYPHASATARRLEDTARRRGIGCPGCAGVPFQLVVISGGDDADAPEGTLSAAPQFSLRITGCRRAADSHQWSASR
jgi:hypothetical protein